MNLLVVSDFLHTAEIASDPQTFDGAEEIFYAAWFLGDIWKNVCQITQILDRDPK